MTTPQSKKRLKAEIYQPQASKRIKASDVDEEFKDKLTYIGSGLKLTSHGNIFQLRLLMLFLQSAKNTNYHKFRLATELSEAEKFDDIIFQYKEKEGDKTKLRLFQAKHSEGLGKCDPVQKIVRGNLLSKNDDDPFSLQKYFRSYLKIQQCCEDGSIYSSFLGSEIEDIVIITNKGIDPDVLRENLTCFDLKNDALLNIGEKSFKAQCYKFKKNAQLKNELTIIFNNSSDLINLAYQLVECFSNVKKIEKVGLFKEYYWPLFREVFEPVKVKTKIKLKKKETVREETKIVLRQDFIQNIKDSSNKDPLVLEIRKLTTHDKLENKQLPTSKDFAKDFEMSKLTILDQLKNFAKQFYDFIKASGENKIVEIIDKNLPDDSFRSHLKILSGHVLTEKFNITRFSSKFLQSNTANFPGNLKEFNRELKELLKDEWEKIHEYEFKIEVKGFFAFEEIAFEQKLPPPFGDEHVEEFFNKLKIVVEFPNRNEINCLLDKNNQNRLKILDGDAHISIYEKKMLSWMTDRTGTFLTPEKAEKLFNDIDNSLLMWKMEGVNESYFSKVTTNYKFKKFDVLIEFLNDNEQKILHLVFHNLELGRTRVVKTFKKLKKKDSESMWRYTRGFGYIFLPLDILQKPKIRSEIWECLGSAKKWNLMVFECNCTEEIDGLKKHLKKAIKDKKFKIIFITDSEEDLTANKFNRKKIEYKSFNDSTSFTDLTKVSRMSLISQDSLCFQGQNNKTSLNDLMKLEKIDSDQEKMDQVHQIIDTESFMKFLTNENICIGSKLPTLRKYNATFFIPRQFNSCVELEDDISRKISDKISIDDNEISFKKLCEQHPQHNVHWLVRKENRVFWKKSKGSIARLLKFRKENEYYDFDVRFALFNMKDFSKMILNDTENKIVVISNSAGMGKSTALVDLAGEIKKIEPLLWVERIDLNNYTKFLLEEKNRRKLKKSCFDGELAIEFIIQMLQSDNKLVFNTCLEKKLFKRSFEHEMSLIIFDGFDEVCSEYEEIVLDLLRNLKNFKVRKLIITTRPSMNVILQNELNVFSNSLVGFSDHNSVDYLVQFWSERLRLIPDKRMKKFAKCLVEKFSESINDCENKFMGIPLHLMMVAEIFQENHEEWQGCKEFLNSSLRQPNLKELKLGLLYIYESFVRKKFHEFYIEEKQIIDSSRGRQLKEVLYKEFRKRHEILALCGLLSEISWDEILSNEEKTNRNEYMQENWDNNQGFINRFVEDKAIFIHLSFAEYFSSFLFANKLSLLPKIVCSVINSLVVNASPVFICSIAKILNDDRIRINEETALHFFTRNKIDYSNIVDALLDIDYQDDLGKTSLHYAVNLNDEQAVDYIINKKNDIMEDVILKHGIFKNEEYAHSKLVKFLNIKDNGNLCAHNNSEANPIITFKLLLKGADVDVLQRQHLDKLTHFMLNCDYDHSKSFDPFTSNILGAYVNQDNKFRPIAEKILKKSPQIFSSLYAKGQARLLSYFFMHGRIEVIKALLSTLKDKRTQIEVLNQNDHKITPLARLNSNDEVSDNERLKILKFLWEEFREIFSHGSDESITKVLSSAAGYGHIETVKYFIIYDHPRNYYNLLYPAIENSHLNVLEYLLNNHREYLLEDGNSPLHCALDCNVGLKIIKYLIEKGEDVNDRNDRGETPLSVAVYRREKLNVIKCLVENGADVNNFNNEKTPLTYALQNRCFDVVKYLLLDCNAKPTNTLTTKICQFFKNPSIGLYLDKLCFAIQFEDVEWTKFLIRQGANVNQRDEDGKTPLHWAAQLDKIKTVEILLQYGAIYDAIDKAGKTPLEYHQKTLFHSDKESASCKICWLLQILNKLLYSCNLNDDFERWLIGFPDESISWGAYGKSKCPDAWEGGNPIIFILGVKNRHRENLVHIASKTNSIKAIETILRFSCDYLKRTIMNSWRNAPIRSINGDPIEDYRPLKIDAVNNDLNSPLHIAACEGFYDIVSLLLENGSTFDASNKDGRNPKYLAKMNNHGEIVELLKQLENFFISIKNDNFEGVKNCTNSDIFINVRDKDGNSPLHYAADLNRDKILKFLLSLSADIEAKNNDDQTVLHYAVKNDKIDNVKIILQHGAIFESAIEENSLSFETNKSSDLLNAIRELFNSIEGGETPEVILDEISLRSLLNIRDSEKNSLLHLAAKANSYKMVDFFLQNGAIFNAINKYDQTSYSIARHLNISRLLKSLEEMFQNVSVDKNVDVKVLTNVRGYLTSDTLLHRAASKGKSDVVDWLLKNGADVNATTADGKTPLHFAVKHGRKNVIKTILTNGADVNVITAAGETALDIARIKGFDDITGLLKSYLEY